MLDTNRRGFLGGIGAASIAHLPVDAADPIVQAAAADLDKYAQLGDKRAGGESDIACGEWFADELAANGFGVSRQHFHVPFFAAETSALQCANSRADVYPQPIVVPTAREGLTGPLVAVDPDGNASGSLQGAIALIESRSGRWSSIHSPALLHPVEKAFAGGASAVVLITNGPTDEIIALNTDGRHPMFAGPFALLAPKNARPFRAAAAQRESARLTMTGQTGRRPAFNLVGRIERPGAKWLAVSTPRSGWFDCVGERGSGVAAWLNLARWAPNGLPNHSLAFICNTGHEYEYLGAVQAMGGIAPPVAQTAFWLHVGANVASADWHEATNSRLPSADSQRWLSVDPRLVSTARSLFAGQPGLEEPVSNAELSAGELDEVIKAGYKLSAGIFGSHRYHHTAGDTLTCANVPATIAAAIALRSLVLRAVSIES